MKYKIILLFFLYSITISFSQKDCKEFYRDYGLHLFAKGEKKLGIQYLHKADSCGFLYGGGYAEIISNPFNCSDEYILNIWGKLVLSYGEDADFEGIAEDYPDVRKTLIKRQLEEKAKYELDKVVAKIRLNLNFTFYRTIYNLRYFDLSHRGRSKFTDNLEIRKKIDSVVLVKLYNFLVENDFPDIYEMGSAHKKIFLMLIHNTRNPDPQAYEKVKAIVDKLENTDYWIPSLRFLFEDEHLINSGRKQKYGRGMALFSDNKTLIFPVIENIEQLDSIRLANHLLPFQFRIEKERNSPYHDKSRTVIVPDGYIFDKNWKDKCRCELIE